MLNINPSSLFRAPSAMNNSNDSLIVQSPPSSDLLVLQQLCKVDEYYPPYIMRPSHLPSPPPQPPENLILSVRGPSRIEGIHH